LWVLYFDNLPEVHHGSSWQQTWAILHLPLHLSFVGILEASRQVAMMRFISQALHRFVDKTNRACLQKHVDGKALADKLYKIIDIFDFRILRPTAEQYSHMRYMIGQIGAMPGICSVENTANMTTLYDKASPTAFPEFKELLYQFTKALFSSDGAEEVLPSAEKNAFTLFERSVKTIYLYYWSSVLCMLLTLIFLYRLTNIKAYKEYDVADLCSMLGRWIMAVLAASFIALYAKSIAWTNFIASRAMLPTLCGILSFVVVVDRLGRLLRARGLKKKLPAREARNDSGRSTEDEEYDLSWVYADAHRLSSTTTRSRASTPEPRESVYSWLMPTAEQNSEWYVDGPTGNVVERKEVRME
jgi:hypothetical protein